ncbi:MAG: hypothetical protein WC604_02895 [Candidatus Gracilibacteria bacterium]
MGPEAARNLDEELVVKDQQDQQEQRDKPELSETPREFENAEVKAFSHEDKERVRSGKASLEDIKKESEQVKEQAETLIDMARGQEKISELEAKRYRKQLNLTQGKAEREQIVDNLQRAIASIHTDKDKTEELSKSDPEIQKAYHQYDRVIDENAHLLGSKPTAEYKKWIREQKSSIANVEEFTIKFFQRERPPRLEAYNQLKKTMAKYGVMNPLDVKYIENEGLSERRAFLKNIQALEKYFGRIGGMKERLYSRETEKTLMKSICEAENPQKQDQILLKAQNLEKQESKGYTNLEAAVRSEKISQKSMDNILDYYKDINDWDQRSENIKLWEGFINNEAKLKDDLKEIFDGNAARGIPKNEEGFSLAFRIFKHLDYTGKESFIKEQRKKREQEVKEEDENKELAIQAFKQECSNAQRKNVISKKTEQNYSDWIDKNAEGKSYKEVKEFLDILTSPQPNEKYKNLKAYEERRKHFQTNVRRLRDVNPLLTDDEAKEWQDRYDNEGWKNREKIDKELKEDISKALESRTKSRVEKAGLKSIEGGKDGKETAELAEKNKETAISAIKSLLKFKAYGSAMKRCTELLKNNPYDEDVLSLLDEITKFADAQSTDADPDKQEKIYDQYSSLAEKMMAHDTEIKEDADEIQTQEQGLILARKDQQQKKKIKSKDRNRDEVMDKVRHDQELAGYADEYLEDGEDDEVLNASTLKGQEVVSIDFDTVDSRTEKKELRRQVRKEQEKAGEHKGSTVIEFEQAKTGRTIDARSGQEAEIAQQKEKEALAAEMAEEIAKIFHPEGDPTPEQLALAKKAALAKLDKKAKTKIERMSE